MYNPNSYRIGLYTDNGTKMKYIKQNRNKHKNTLAQ